MDGPHLKDGKVRLYKREQNKKWQARIKLSNGVWKRITIGESDLDQASRIACDKYEEYRVLKKKNIIFESRRFKDVAGIAITEMQKELESGYGKKSFIDYIQALNRYFIPYFGNTYLNNIDYRALQQSISGISKSLAGSSHFIAQPVYSKLDFGRLIFAIHPHRSIYKNLLQPKPRVLGTYRHSLEAIQSAFLIFIAVFNGPGFSPSD